MKTRYLGRAMKGVGASLLAVGLAMGLGSTANASFQGPESPTTGGALAAEGSSGSVAASTGAATTSVAFVLPPARGEAGPSLSLAYSSRAGEGEAGVGWNLSLPTIRRVAHPAASTAVFPSPEDTFEVNGETLVRVCNATCPGASDSPPNAPGMLAAYRLQADPASAVYYLFPNSFRVVHLGGLVEEFGTNEESREQSNGTIFGYELTSRRDRNNNRTTYQWSKDPVGLGHGRGLSYLTHVYWNSPLDPHSDSLAEWEHHLALTWEAGPERAKQTPVWAATPGYRLAQVSVASKPPSGTGLRELVRRYHLSYLGGAGAPADIAPPTYGRSYLYSVVEEGRCATPQADPPVQGASQTPAAPLSCPSLPATTYTYSAPAFWPRAHDVYVDQRPGAPPINPWWVAAYDIDQDGLPDLLDKAAGRIYRNTGESPEHSIHMVEDCFTTDEWVALSGPLPGMAGLEKAPLLNPLSGLTVPWPAQSGNAAFRFRYAESGPIPGWMGAEISPKGAACAGPTTVGPRRSWTLLSRPAPELAAFGTKVQFVTDVNGDGLPDALVRMDTHSDTRLRAHLSKYKMGGPYPAVPFMSPA